MPEPFDLISKGYGLFSPQGVLLATFSTEEVQRALIGNIEFKMRSEPGDWTKYFCMDNGSFLGNDNQKHFVTTGDYFQYLGNE